MTAADPAGGLAGDPGPPADGTAYNLAAALLEPNLARGEAVALYVADGSSVSYADLSEQVARTSDVLRGLDVRAEERVVLVLPDSPELVVTLLAVLRVGAVAVPLNPALTGAALAYQVADSRARLAVGAGAALTELAGLVGDPGCELRTVASWDAPGGVTDLAELASAADPTAEVAATTTDDVALFLYSSGTTGRPKAVAHVHGAPAHSYHGFARGVLGITAADRTFSVPKMFSPSGLGNSVFFPFFAGGSSVLLREPAAGPALTGAVRNGRPTLLFGRPVNYRELLDQVPAEQLRARLAVCSGERLDPRLREQFVARYGVEVLEGTGSTEALHIYLCNRPGRARPGSSGEVVPGYEARLVDEDGRQVSPGEVGDLQLRGGSTFLCYWRNRARTRETIVGEWVNTGDKYRQDADGYFWHAGRSDDMWFDEGWVSPVEIEEAIETHPAVREAAVTRTTVDDAGPGVLACVVLAAPDAAAPDGLEAELADLVESRLDGRRRPRWVRIVPSLPRTVSGKVQRYRLGELVRAT
ncbi:MAG TPA: benzoate-CoA ligase family protein [Micromonosporaceae bacterium]|nr:benzoate-CoA ligase family protein [Micromonosporaceae bacterium]